MAVTTTTSPHVVRRFTITALAVPILVTAVALTLQLTWLGDLPDPAATHWGMAGSPDGFGASWTFPAVTTGLGLGLPVLVAITTLPMLRRGARSGTFRFMGAFALGMSAFLATLNTWSVHIQRGLASATDAPGVLPAMIFSLCVGALLGVAGWLYQPHQEAQILEGEPSAEMVLAPGERVVWMRVASMARPHLALLGVVGVGIVAAAVAAWVAGEFTAAWLLVGALAAVALAAAATSVFHVRVDDSGLTAVAALGFPRVRLPLDDVAKAGVAPVDGFAEFGGYGLRSRPGATGIILRNGTALQVTRMSGRRLVITVDDAESAAALLTALAARASSGKDV